MREKQKVGEVELVPGNLECGGKGSTEDKHRVSLVVVLEKCRHRGPGCTSSDKKASPVRVRS